MWTWLEKSRNSASNWLSKIQRCEILKAKERVSAAKILVQHSLTKKSCDYAKRKQNWCKMAASTFSEIWSEFEAEMVVGGKSKGPEDIDDA